MERLTHKDSSSSPIPNRTEYMLWNIKLNIELKARRLNDVCVNDSPDNSTLEFVQKSSYANDEAMSLITNKISDDVFRGIVDNRGRLWLKWECLKSNGNIEEYTKPCQNVLLAVTSIGIVKGKTYAPFIHVLEKPKEEVDL
ncbi:hypothetical protein O181_063351 [Austropuccinia psidii MF-1]|uniref:Uncharacterized protein n=1 Tax=Austropuccinia psidii MF-1 TaxID=1389203 RepID=A0A9Q3EJV9_9BASI|nr:hypothetical protein [Austropuccinia psidii MF-1]